MATTPPVIPHTVCKDNPQFNHSIPQCKPRQTYHSAGMRGHCIGPIPTKTFLGDMGKDVSYNKDAFKACVKRADFKPVSLAKDEAQMHRSFALAARKLKISERMEFFVCSNKSDTPDEIRADVGARQLSLGSISDQWIKPDGSFDDEAFDYYCDLLAIEIKTRNERDPFLDDLNSCTNPGAQGSETRGQIGLYADLQFARQHRLFLYQLIIIGQHARFIYYDRAGLVVSESFDYVKDKKQLVMFLWLLAHMTEEQQGWDPTVRPATEAEQMVFVRETLDFLDDVTNGKGLAVPQIYDPANSKSPIYVAQVPEKSGSDTTREVIIGAPFHTSRSVPGRGTCTYLAYDPTDGEIRVLKDSWGVVHPAVLPETRVYDILREHDVPSLPDVICGGEVRWNGTIQRTTVQVWTEEHSGVRVAPFSSHMQCLNSSEEFVEVLRDIIFSYDVARNLAGVLHRDLTPGNIVLKIVDDHYKGILIDWDHAGYEFRTSAPDDTTDDLSVPYTSATWQFASIGLLSEDRDNRYKHGPLDDMQSVLWILLYGGIHYFEHETASSASSPVNLFDDWRDLDRPEAFPSIFSGGVKKREALATQTKLTSLSFTSKALQGLINTLVKQWIKYYAYQALQPLDLHREEYEDVRRCLEDPKWLLEQFNGALEEGRDHKTWLEDRVPVENYLPRSDRDEHRQRENSITNSFASTTGGKGTGLQLKRQKSRPRMIADRAAAKRRREDADADFKPIGGNKKAKKEAENIPDDDRSVTRLQTETRSRLAGTIDAVTLQTMRIVNRLRRR
ncbi:hypothetical protein PsYK624_082320 [Phanerochaete sordida]|uniref:Fungal-type protein kinase domain-containing protein n=1 Tax=Phanerochaete sordida TaxID=48140 RepID=A0A9P3LEZ3_9APHY|nr:hypothetical protein PsYK624_082320 [Phanerochaete sordida]